jgi:hypothetical protein
VGFEGPKTSSKLDKLISATPEGERPDGAFVVRSGAYSGCDLSKSTRKAEGWKGFLIFANDLAWLIRNVQWAAPQLGPYVD